LQCEEERNRLPVDGGDRTRIRTESCKCGSGTGLDQRKERLDAARELTVAIFVRIEVSLEGRIVRPGSLRLPVANV
jgi:hypothetical protein